MHELLLAARAGDIEKVKACLARGDNIEMQEGDSGTPLFCAVAEGHIEIVKLLLEKGAKVNARNCHGWEPIHVAAQKNRLEIMFFLLEYANEEDLLAHIFSNKRSSLIRPNWSNSPYKEEAWGLDASTLQGDTAFHLAALYGHFEILKLLMDKFPNGIYLEGEDRNTLLHYATQQGHIDCVDFLLQQGALIVRNCDDVTPLHIAVKKNYLGILDLLLTKTELTDVTSRYPGCSDRDTPFHAAAWAGNLDALQRLLCKFPDGYLLDGVWGNKLWFTALDQNHFAIVHFLIEKYGNKILFQPSSHYGLPIQLAVHRYVFESNSTTQSALQYLIQAMLEKNPALTIFVGLWKWRDIQAKLSKRQDAFAEFLLKTINHNLVYETFRANASLLHIAVENINLSALQGLMGYIKNMNSQDEKGNTPLHYAAHNINLFHHLRLATGADITLRNKQGLTPLDIVKTYLDNYETQAAQYDQAFLAANLVCRLLNKIRRWQLINQANATFKFFKLSIDLQRAVLFTDEKVPLSLLSDRQVQNVIDYGQQRATLNPSHKDTASDKVEFLQRIGTSTQYGFFAAGQFMPPKEQTLTQSNNNKNHLTV